MPAQYPFGSANDKYKKKLFVDTGPTFVEVRAKVIEPYSPPSPNPNFRELKIIHAPSHFHQMGISSYKSTMTLLFPDKQSYVEYLMFCGWTHKFYDEHGAIYLGALDSSPKVRAVEANKRYVVEISLTLIKKDAYDEENRFEFIDLDDESTGNPHWAKSDIVEMANLGLISVLEADGSPVLYFRPNAYITRAEFVAFLNRTRRFIVNAIRE